MVMNEREILQGYREAKDQWRQIKILAELNACGVGEIIQVLEAGGERIDGRWYKREWLERAAPAEEEKERKEEPLQSALPTAPPEGEPAPEGEGDEETPHPSRAERVPPSPQGEGFGNEDETVLVRDALPMLIRMVAVETIAERLADVGRSDEDNAEAFCEQVRGILALVHEVERRCEG